LETNLEKYLETDYRKNNWSAEQRDHIDYRLKGELENLITENYLEPELGLY